MNEEHKNALEATQDDVCENLDPEDILSYLFIKGIVQEEHAEEIMV